MLTSMQRDTMRVALAIALGVTPLWVARPAVAQEPPAGQRRVRVVQRDTVRDSSFMKVTMSTESVERMIRELLASRELEQTIAMSLKEAAAGMRTDPRRMRELSDSVREIARRNAGLMTQIQMKCVNEGTLPAGYLGVQFDMQTISVSGNEPAVFELGTVVSVTPGSPAERAGIKADDILLSIGGVNARKPIALDPILKPGAKVQVKLQRGRATKDVMVLVEKRPEDYGSDCAHVEQLIGPENNAPVIFFNQYPARAPTMIARTPMPPQGGTLAPAAPVASPLPMAAGFGSNFAFSTSGNAAIAGMTLIPLDDDWRQTLGVDNGLLVIKVLPGTSAKDAGLRSGDVIISADGEVVGSVRPLQRIISNASNSKANSITLQVIRAGKKQAITLRWQERER